MHPLVSDLYNLILSHGPAGIENYYAALRQRGIEPQPDQTRGLVDLYAPNPVVVWGPIVRTMTADANAFCEFLLHHVSDAAALLARMPNHVTETFASLEVAEQILASNRKAHPLTSLDAFLVETPDGLVPAYIEWQTAGSYLTLGRWVMECIAKAWPEVQSYSTLTAWPGLTLEDLSGRLTAIYMEGIEDDPRQGVIVDYCPHQQVTRREFYAIQELTGGSKKGMGILDPREILYAQGRPMYRRNGDLIEIRRAYSRLVFSEMLALKKEATSSELDNMRRFFQDGYHITWINHPLHFFYGSKADFPLFWKEGLSSALPECLLITEEWIHLHAEKFGREHRLDSFVLKPTDLQSGLMITRNPEISELRPGWVLQLEIHPAACHPTLFGQRTPEIRIMCLPDESGQLIAGLIFTRVKAQQVFLSGAGHTAQLNIPGTGEGYGVVVYETTQG